MPGPKRPGPKGPLKIQDIKPIRRPANSNGVPKPSRATEGKSHILIKTQIEFPREGLSTGVFKSNPVKRIKAEMIHKKMGLKIKTREPKITPIFKETPLQTIGGVLKHLALTLIDAGGAMFTWLGRTLRKIAQYYQNRPGAFLLMAFPIPPARGAKAKSTELSFMPDMVVNHLRMGPEGKVSKLKETEGFRNVEGLLWIQEVRSPEGKLIDYHVAGKPNAAQQRTLDAQFKSKIDHLTQRDYILKFPYYRDIAYESGTGRLMKALDSFLIGKDIKEISGLLTLNLFNSPKGYYFTSLTPSNPAAVHRPLGRITFKIEEVGGITRVHVERAELRADRGVAESFHTSFFQYYLKKPGSPMVQLPE